ncbi:Thiosulfate sulfurtransferase [Sporotomaculum syntrophicum]|uniref:thiosulfate sulfurtransferase n=1 Tax=Sporotomaculum syntrophicum TaxID=182264 RepID=A0A9D3AY00_9FIRM|nr:sulfurtransferase [Sporotomaculum syntrophicum]KAF1085527.1 Thiosulfate sulfurtransferase [Sporotomaculum syntrophicum]
MKIKKLLVVFMVLALLAGLAGCAKTSQEPNKTNETPKAAATDQLKEQLYVDAGWLKANLDKVIVLDVRKADEYAAGHIPGSINAPWQSLANMIGKPGDKGWGTILPADELAAKLGSMGINGNKTVVTYAAPPGWGEDGRVLWVLNMAGITNAKMLDGGWQAWQAAKGEKSKDVPNPTPVAFTIAGLNQDLNVTTDYIKANLDKLKIVDARSEKEYQGATDFGEARGGHLPGAISLPFEKMYQEDGKIKSSDELKALFAEAGLTPKDEIVTYCTKGIRSGYMAMVLRNLGFDKARNWDASYYEWAGDASLPLEK